MTKEEQIESLTKQIEECPRIAAKAILCSGMRWDGRAIHNEWAGRAHKRLSMLEGKLHDMQNILKGKLDS